MFETKSAIETGDERSHGSPTNTGCVLPAFSTRNFGAVKQCCSDFCWVVGSHRGNNGAVTPQRAYRRCIDHRLFANFCNCSPCTFSLDGGRDDSLNIGWSSRKGGGGCRCRFTRQCAAGCRCRSRGGCRCFTGSKSGGHNVGGRGA